MSKTNPNQDHYKTGGRTQTDGPDRADAKNASEDKAVLAKTDKEARSSNHPAVMRSKKK